jgi:hypothetical protein
MSGRIFLISSKDLMEYIGGKAEERVATRSPKTKPKQYNQHKSYLRPCQYTNRTNHRFFEAGTHLPANRSCLGGGLYL